MNDMLDELVVASAGMPGKSDLERARYLIENYLWNEDGEDDAWLVEARDIVNAAIEDEARSLSREGLRRAIEFIENEMPGGTTDRFMESYERVPESFVWRRDVVAYLRSLSSPPDPPSRPVEREAER